MEMASMLLNGGHEVLFLRTSLSSSPYRSSRRGFTSSPLILTSSRCLVVNASLQVSCSLKTCRNCKQQFDPVQNHPRACRFHTAHFGGETRRKFESVYEGGTMNTPDGGKISQYWHCCGISDPADLGCEFSPHLSYDD